MKLVNAGIKSKKELATRLMDGEVFWSNGGLRVYYEDKEDAPFRVGCKPIHTGWSEYRNLKKEVLWYKNIESPVLCYVSDSSETDKSCVRIVKGYDEDQSYPYTAMNNGSWKYATPISQEEVNQWVLA